MAAELERSDTFPEAIVTQMRDLGLFGVTITETYGGLGLDLLTDIGIIEETGLWLDGPHRRLWS